LYQYARCVCEKYNALLHENVVSDSTDVTSKMDQRNLGSIDHNEDSGNAVLTIENAYCNTEEGGVKDFRKRRSEKISGGLGTRDVNRRRVKGRKNKVMK
jgi:hypothetical protein